MKYYIDTEFIECAKQRKVLGFKVGKPVPTIDLISIALVAEDGREFFALNAECELDYAWADEWVRENVLLPIWHKYTTSGMKFHNVNPFSLGAMKRIFMVNGRSKKQLPKELYEFVFSIQGLVNQFKAQRKDSFAEANGDSYVQFGLGQYLDREQAIATLIEEKAFTAPRFYGYYSDYDWVVFCQLFGRMINLPDGFPMFCLDLKQEMERLGAPDTIKPNNGNEHDALADARWNKLLHQRLLAQYPNVA